MSQIQIFNFGMEISNIVLLSIILLLPLMGLGLTFLINKPRYFDMVGLMLGVLLNIPYIFLLNIGAEHIGWWTFHPSENSFYNIPIELAIGWAFFWGALMPYLFKGLPIIVPIIIVVLIDLWLMPQMDGLFKLEDHWFIGDMIMVVACLIPSLLIFKLTYERRAILLRALIQSYIWGGWFVFLIPAITLYFEGIDIFSIFEWSLVRVLIFIAAMGMSMAIGYAALWEFATKGKGTPIPFDPPKNLVTTGIYAYVANQLQI